HALWRRGVIPHQLVLVGGRGWQDAAIYDTIAQLNCGDALRLAGYVPTADLPALYSAADAFAFPSLSEGFGLPVIEAMACGTPLLAALTLLYSLLYIALLRPWQTPDEPTVFEYAALVSRLGRVPTSVDRDLALERRIVDSLARWHFFEYLIGHPPPALPNDLEE